MGKQRFSVGILGAGNVAFGTAAVLASRGHQVVLWSPSGDRTKLLASGSQLEAYGALEGRFEIGVADSAEHLASVSEVVVTAAPGYAHKFLLDAVAPFLTKEHTVIFGSHCSFDALYLSKILSARDIEIPMVALGTTIATSRQISFNKVEIGVIRQEVDACGFPERLSREALETAKAICGDRFVDRGSLLAIALSNFNPQHHMGIGLCNMTRMEYAEDWNQPHYVSPNTGRLLEALDRERLAIADRLGVSVRNIFEFFQKSYDVPLGSVSEMNQEIYRQGKGGPGPKTADNRYAHEDVPFGLEVTTRLGRLTGAPATLHQAGIEILEATHGIKLSEKNDLLDSIGIDDLDLASLISLCKEGFLRGQAAPSLQ